MLLVRNHLGIACSTWRTGNLTVRKVLQSGQFYTVIVCFMFMETTWRIKKLVNKTVSVTHPAWILFPLSTYANAYISVFFSSLYERMAESLPQCPQYLPSRLSLMYYQTLHFFSCTFSPFPLPSLVDSAHQKYKISLLGLPTIPLSRWSCDLWCCCLTLELFNQHLGRDSSTQMCSTW